MTEDVSEHWWLDALCLEVASPEDAPKTLPRVSGLDHKIAGERPRRLLDTGPGCGRTRMRGSTMTDVSAERWLPVVGFEGRYEVSDLGNIRSADRTFVRYSRGVRQVVRWKQRPRKQFQHPTGYMQVNLRHPNRPKGYAKVHRLVLEAFVGPCPDGMECCHANDVHGDNRLENLRWDTPSANARDKIRNGRDSQSNKTRCPQNHEYTPENTRILANGARRCRTCARAQNSAWQKRNREKCRAKSARYQAKIAAPKEVTCRECGEIFERRGGGPALYCEPRCRRRAYRRIYGEKPEAA